MSRVKPILFNTEMVRAILDGKTVTRRVIKFPTNRYTGQVPIADKVSLTELRIDKANFSEEPFYGFDVKPPYQLGDILYVRETWKIVDYLDKLSLKFEYEADGKISDFIDFASNRLQKFLKYIGKKGWCPALFMPKEAARIWLKVTDLRVERLQDITEEQAEKEGIRGYSKDGKLYKYAVTDDWWIHFHNKHKKSFTGSWWQDMPRTAKKGFSYLWNSTLKKSGIDRYGWDANPWVWVIEFEQCKKSESEDER